MKRVFEQIDVFGGTFKRYGCSVTISFSILTIRFLIFIIILLNAYIYGIVFIKILYRMEKKYE